MMSKEELDHVAYMQSLATLRNIISILAFTALAALFGKWWISLLALLFLCEYKFKAGTEEEEETEDEEKREE